MDDFFIIFAGKNENISGQAYAFISDGKKEQWRKRATPLYRRDN